MLYVVAAFGLVLLAALIAYTTEEGPMSKYIRDLIERVIWTAAQAGVGVLVVANTETPTAYAAVIAAGLALVKGFVAKKVGNPDSAALGSGV